MYFKDYKDEKALIILNGNDSEKKEDIKLINDLCGKVSSVYDMINNKSIDITYGYITLKPMSSNIYLIKWPIPFGSKYIIKWHSEKFIKIKLILTF